MQHRDKITIQKVIAEMNIGIQILRSTDIASFMNDEVIKRALSMTVINVGELIKVVTEELRLKYKDFPWRAVAGMRDIAAHRYQTLRMEDVYTTVCSEYPELVSKLESIIEMEERL